jgi:hypothetical protein
MYEAAFTAQSARYKDHCGIVLGGGRWFCPLFSLPNPLALLPLTLPGDGLMRT